MAAMLTVAVLIPLLVAYNRAQRSFRTGNQELRIPAIGAEALDEMTRKLYYGNSLFFAPTPYPPAIWPNSLAQADWPRFACGMPAGGFVMYRYNSQARTIETKTSAASDDLNVETGWATLPLAGQSLQGLLVNHDASSVLAAAQRLPFVFTDARGNPLNQNPSSATDSRRVEIRLLLSSASSPPLYIRTSVSPRNIPHF